MHSTLVHHASNHTFAHTFHYICHTHSYIHTMYPLTHMHSHTSHALHIPQYTPTVMFIHMLSHTTYSYMPQNTHYPLIQYTLTQCTHSNIHSHTSHEIHMLHILTQVPTSCTHSHTYQHTHIHIFTHTVTTHKFTYAACTSSPHKITHPPHIHPHQHIDHTCVLTPTPLSPLSS